MTTQPSNEHDRGGRRWMCSEKRRLGAEYGHTLVSLNVSLELQATAGSNNGFPDTSGVGEDLRLKCDRAWRALEKHRIAHGC